MKTPTVAVVTNEFTGRPDHDAAARLIKKGETITGDLADVAIDAGNAEETKDSKAAKATHAKRVAAAQAAGKRAKGAAKSSARPKAKKVKSAPRKKR